MIAIALAEQLRDAGLVWRPEPLDFFALPGRQMDEDVFVISDQAAFLQLYNGYPVVAFHGSTEWALDYILINDVTWIPTETQLRQQIERRLAPDALLRIDRTSSGYRCLFGTADQIRETDASDAETALAQTLIELLHLDTRAIDDR